MQLIGFKVKQIETSITKNKYSVFILEISINYTDWIDKYMTLKVLILQDE